MEHVYTVPSPSHPLFTGAPDLTSLRKRPKLWQVYFRRGDLVWVDGRYPARVESSSGDLVKVSYETLGFADSKNPSPKIPRRSRNCRWICFPTQIQPVAKGKLICFCYLLLFFPREKPR